MKTKSLISFSVTAKLICVFVFAYAKRLVSHDAAHIYSEITSYNVEYQLPIVFHFHLLNIYFFFPSFYSLFLSLSFSFSVFLLFLCEKLIKVTLTTKGGGTSRYGFFYILQ